MYNGIPFQELKVICVKDEQVANYFIDQLYPYHIECMIISADGVYPKDKNVAEKLWDTLKKDKRVGIVTIGKGCSSYLKNVATSKIIALDDILEQDIKNNFYNFEKGSFMVLIHALLKLLKHDNFQSDTIRADIGLRTDLNPFTYNDQKNILETDWKGKLLGCFDTMKVETIDFQTAKKIWSKGLWQEKESDILPISTWTILKDYSITTDMEIKKYIATYFAVQHRGNWIGINSGHKNNENLYRSRGLWVSDKYQGLGISKMLLNATITHAKKVGCKSIWTFPRKSSLFAYESAGFVKVSDWSDQGDFGPNCVAIKSLYDDKI